MTNEEAVKWLRAYPKMTDFTMPQIEEALDMAEKALMEQAQADGEHDGCKDCKYETYPEYYYPCCECKQNYMDKWKARPKEEPKVGKWLGVNKNTWCSNCAIAISQYIKGDFTIDAENLPNYCPHCGAKMD